jgi:fructokinase
MKEFPNHIRESVAKVQACQPAGEGKMKKLYGGIEAGGTKFVCIVATSPDEILSEIRIPTTSPHETLAKAVHFFRPYVTDLISIGIGSFGPLDLDFQSPTYGSITTTPKPGWSQVDLRGEIERALGVPVAIDTDVNAAALGEHFWVTENRDLDPFLYITVGTGIGVGVIAGGRPLHGLVHPEGGHIFIPHNLIEDPFVGFCPYHGDCWEGLASGPAMKKRWGIAAENLPDDHPGWELEAKYLALAICNLICSLSPQRIVLGGGVLQHPGLLARVRGQVLKLLNGYIRSARLLDQIDSYIVSPSLGQRAGVLGAVALAASLENQSVPESGI